MTGDAQYLHTTYSAAEKTQAWLHFVASCCVSEGNQAGRFASIAVVFHFHRVDVQVDLPTSLPLIKRALTEIAPSHVATVTPKRNCRLISWGTLLGGQGLARSWDPGGRVVWMCLKLADVFVERSDKLFVPAFVVVQAVQYLTKGDVAPSAGGQQLVSLQWHQTTSDEVCCRGHKGHQAQQGSVIVRTRDGYRGERSEVGPGSGAVALVMELLSRHRTLLDSAPL